MIYAKYVLGKVSATALVASLCAFSIGSTKAADLGGNCCADLEERIAELEATTVRKGNRKVSLQISGAVSHAVMWWNDGHQSDMYIGDIGSNAVSQWRLTGTAAISAQLTAGFTYEFGVNNNNLSAANQLNGGDDLGGSTAPELRDSTVWLRHKQFGMIKIGHGSTATDNLILINLAGIVDGASSPDIALLSGGFLLRGNSGRLAGATTVNWAQAIRGHESFDTLRRNHVLYETPSLAGFTFSAAIAEDNFWDVALRYAGEFNGIRIAGGVGYSVDTEFNGFNQSLNQAGLLCTQFPPNTTGLGSFCDTKTETLYASGSILHLPTGLFLTGAYADRKLSGGNSNLIGGVQQTYSGPDARMLYSNAGLARNFFGFGQTVLFADWSRHSGGLAQASFLGTASQVNVATCIGGVVLQGTGAALAVADAGASCNNTIDVWGLGLQQHIDATAMTLYATYHNFSISSDALIGNSRELASRNGGVNDFSVFIVGTRISF